MTEKPPFTAGTMRAVPVRVHVYPRGLHMICDVDNQGCWTDPEGRVLLPSLELVDRVLAAHGYVRQEMAVVPKVASEPPAQNPEPTPEPVPESSPSPAPEPEPEPEKPSKPSKSQRRNR